MQRLSNNILDKQSKRVLHTLLFAILVFPGCSNINESLEELDGNLNNLETVQIKSIQDQMSSISTSITDLKAVDEALHSLISGLETEQNELCKQLEDKAAADILVRKELEEKLSQLRAQTEVLKSRSEELENKTKELEEYVDDQLRSSRDWASATFTTLEQYAALQSEISAIRELLDQYKSELSKKIESAIAVSETSMKSWVNTLLSDGYYDIAEIDGKIAALETKMTEGDVALGKELEALSSALDQAKSDLADSYRKAIEEAIESNNGILRDEIAEAVQTAIDSVSSELSAMNETVAKIRDEVIALQQEIATIASQMSSINASITDLKAVDETLRALISELKVDEAELHELLENNVYDDVTEKKEFEKHILLLQDLIEGLQIESEELENNISELKEHVDNHLQSSMDWASSTFATLEHYSAVQAEIVALRTLLKQCHDEVSAELLSNIEEEITSCEASMKKWVNKFLAEGYYDIATIDGKMAALVSIISDGDDSLYPEIEEMSSALEQAKLELKAAYEAAITNAIEEYDGKIDVKIKDIVGSAVADADVASIESRLSALELKLLGIEEQLEALLSMIQSVAYIPRYSTNVSYVNTASRSTEMDFKISPSSVVSSLESVWPDALAIKYVTTSACASSPEIKDLSIISAEFDKESGTVCLTVNCENLDDSFFKGTTTASATLSISKGQTSISSSFIKLLPAFELGEDLSYTKDITELSLNSTATTATFAGTAMNLSIGFEVGILYSLDPDFTIRTCSKVNTFDFGPEQDFKINLSSLREGTKYYYCLYSGYAGHYSYGDIKEFTTAEVTPLVSIDKSSITATTASFSGTVRGLSEVDKSIITVGMAYSSESADFHNNENIKVPAETISEQGTFSLSITNIPHGTEFYYCPYIEQDGICSYGETQHFITTAIILHLSVVESSVTGMNASFIGSVSGLSESDKPFISIGLAYSYVSDDFLTNDNTTVLSETIADDGVFEVSIDRFNYGTTYYYCPYIKQNSDYTYGEVKSFTTIPDNYITAIKDLDFSAAVDLSATSSANCYIVSESGLYKFKTVKGNSTTSVGTVSSGSILWETFGTDVQPERCDLIAAISYKDGYIAFKTADDFREGNAVLAAKNADGKILWSWHIWMTDMPQEQIYNNNIGVWMDRNLGATSATPGEIEALGLIYQWGRKDPFLNVSPTSLSHSAASTIPWPDAVTANYAYYNPASTGRVSYTIANPTTFLKTSGGYDHWNKENRAILWQSNKTIYDPCPIGWRIPDQSLGSAGLVQSNKSNPYYDEINKGCSLNISSPESWYPAAGFRVYDGSYRNYGSGYWYYSPQTDKPLCVYFDDDWVLVLTGEPSSAYSVRCCRE